MTMMMQYRFTVLALLVGCNTSLASSNTGIRGGLSAVDALDALLDAPEESSYLHQRQSVEQIPQALLEQGHRNLNGKGNGKNGGNPSDMERQDGSVQTLPGMNLWEWAVSETPWPTCGDPGQNEAFQGRSLTNNQGVCDKINICHGNAGFGWNRITVSRSSLGHYSAAGAAGHAEEEHNNRSNKRADYFPSSHSVPNPYGAGINGALDENCGFVPGTTDSPTSSPTESPTGAPTPPTEEPGSPGAFGDPHFTTWQGATSFEYHGECDLVLVQAPALDMDIHIRTSIRYDYSFISEAAVRIGDETFEVASWGEYQLDGMQSVDLPVFVGGFPVTREVLNVEKQKYRFQIHMESTIIQLNSFKDYVSVKIVKADPAHFQGSRGIMGDYDTGIMYGRNGTVMEDPEVYAPQWQVRPEEDGVLFNAHREPQYPRQCVLPSPTAVHARRLGEAKVSRQQAEAACASWKLMRASCISDVLKTGDLDLALLGEDMY